MGAGMKWLGGALVKIASLREKNAVGLPAAGTALG